MADAALPRTGLALLAAAGNDPVTIYKDNIRSIGAHLEAAGAIYEQGLLGSRPSAGKAGRFYKATDTPEDNLVYYDTGTTWVPIGAGAAADPAPGTPGLRTLGAGVNQAAPGTHSHGIASIVGAGNSAALNVGTVTGTVADGGTVNDLFIHSLMGSL